MIDDLIIYGLPATAAALGFVALVSLSLQSWLLSRQQRLQPYRIGHPYRMPTIR